jgi:hypothetical protein
MKKLTKAKSGVSSDGLAGGLALKSVGIPPEPSRPEELEASRSQALLRASVESVQHLDEPGILALQAVLQHGDRYGHWVTPRKWKPSEHSAATMNVDLRQRITSFLSEEHQDLVRKANEERLHINDAVVAGQVSGLSTSITHVHRILNEAVLSLTRYLVLLRIGPSGLGKGKGSPLDPANVKSFAYATLPPLFALAVSKQLAPALPHAIHHVSTGEFGLFHLLRYEDLEKLTKSQRDAALTEAKRMRALSEQGLWNDVLPFTEPLAAVTAVAGPFTPWPRKPGRKPHLPLPDDYVSKMGRRSLWLIYDLAPALLTVIEEIRSIWRATDDLPLTIEGIKQRRTRELKKFLSTFHWHDSQGQLIVKPPFDIHLSERRESKGETAESDAVDDDSAPEVEIAPDVATKTLQWPPRNFNEIMGLAYAVQLAHLFVVSLSMGSRKSETLDLKRWCVQWAPDGVPFATGLTFKLVQRHDGELRDWVLPDVAAQAVEQQVRLVTLAEAIGPIRPAPSSAEGTPSPEMPAMHLWAQVSGLGQSDRTQPLLNLTKALTTYAITIGMDPAPGGQNLRPHRLRKTVARLVALALTQAPKVLMDVFGHKSIEMTLYYILTDKELRAEIEQVARELRVMRAKEVVESIVMAEDAGIETLPLGGYGGPAALMVKRAIVVHQEKLHRQGDEWGAQTAMELAEILTLQGKAWQLVRPGVICTKFSGTESGPCNRNKGHPEPSRCQSDCRHRLEEGFLREDVDGAIRDSLMAYAEAEAAGDDLVQALWAGQIRAHLPRFEDLRLKWMNDSVVQRVVGESESENEGAMA